MTTSSDVHNQIVHAGVFVDQIFSSSPANTIVSVVVGAAQFRTQMMVIEHALYYHRVERVERAFPMPEIVVIQIASPSVQIVITFGIAPVLVHDVVRVNHPACRVPVSRIS